VFLSFDKLKIEPLVTLTILTMSLITFQGRQFSFPQEAYGLVCRFHQKYLNLCSEDEWRS